MARMHIAHTAPLTNPRVREAEAHRSPALRFQLRACKSITTLEQFMELDELQRRKILSPDKFTVDQLKEVDEFLQRYPKLEVPPNPAPSRAIFASLRWEERLGPIGIR